MQVIEVSVVSRPSLLVGGTTVGVLVTTTVSPVACAAPGQSSIVPVDPEGERHRPVTIKTAAQRR